MSPELTVTSPPTFVLNKPVLFPEIIFKFPSIVVVSLEPLLIVAKVAASKIALP